MSLQDTIEGKPRTDEPRKSKPKTAAELLIWVHQRFSEKTKEDKCAVFVEMVLMNEPINVQVVREWFSLHFNTLTKPAKSPDELEAERKAKEEKKAAAVAEEAMIEATLLSQIGQRMLTLARKLTFRECGVMGGQIAKIFDLCPPGKEDELVSSFFTDEQLKTALQRKS